MNEILDEEDADVLREISFKPKYGSYKKIYENGYEEIFRWKKGEIVSITGSPAALKV